MYRTMITYHTDMFMQSNEHVGLSEASNQTRVAFNRYGHILRFRIPEFVPSFYTLFYDGNASQEPL